MPYLLRVNVRPDLNSLSANDRAEVERNFAPSAAEFRLYKETLLWAKVDEIELVKAARMGGLSGWIVKRVIAPQDRYHLGIYLGKDEAVMSNLTLAQALYVIQAIAYYAPNRVNYKGEAGIVPTVNF
jgi:hypothetical protein